MSAEFPLAKKTFQNPVATNKLSNPSHAKQHADVNDEMTAVQDYLIGIGTLTNSATPTVAAGYKKWITGGTTTITNILGGSTGLEIIILAEHSVAISDGASITLSGGTTFNMAATDSLTLIQKSNGCWYELSRSDNA